MTNEAPYTNSYMLNAYSNQEKRKGLLPEFVLDIDPKGNYNESKKDRTH